MLAALPRPVSPVEVVLLACVARSGVHFSPSISLLSRISQATNALLGRETRNVPVAFESLFAQGVPAAFKPQESLEAYGDNRLASRPCSGRTDDVKNLARSADIKAADDARSVRRGFRDRFAFDERARNRARDRHLDRHVGRAEQGHQDMSEELVAGNGGELDLRPVLDRLDLFHLVDDAVRSVVRDDFRLRREGPGELRNPIRRRGWKNTLMPRPLSRGRSSD